MTHRLPCRAALLLAACALLVPAARPAHAEVVEEIVAIVNGEIITKTDFEEEEALLVAELYRQFSGAELDRRLEEVRAGLLMQMIDREVRLAYAKRQFDIDRMRNSFYEQFVRQQMQEYDIETREEFEALLARDGMTPSDLKDRLLKTFAPEEVLRYEVGSRVAIDDPEVRAYYDGNLEQFEVAGEATVREIVLLAADEAAREGRRAEAEAVVERARAGESFGDLARDVSESGTAEQGGALGVVNRGDLSTTLEEVAFSLSAGETSDPIETDYGWHVLHVETRTEDRVRSFDEVEDQVRRFLDNRKYLADVKEFTLKIRDEADWCVKQKYSERLPGDVDPILCRDL